MAKQEEIRDFQGKILGYIVTENNGDKTVRNFTGKILGVYDLRNKVTRTFTGKIIAQGDVSTGLLFNQNKYDTF